MTAYNLPSGARLFTLDANYLYPEFAAVYLYEYPTQVPRVDGLDRRFHLIDCATAPCFEILVKQISDLGISLHQIQSLWITHVHLDHAGGASRWCEELKHLKIYCHPRTARHLVQPERLVASALQVYGPSKFRELYGEIKAIPKENVLEVEDGKNIFPGGPQFIYTRGHANHHGCFYLPQDRIVFSGDTFGLHYPKLPFCLPSTSPTDFDSQLAIQSIEQLVRLDCDAIYPTHFGRVENIREKAQGLIDWLQWSANWQNKLASHFDKIHQEQSTKMEHPLFLDFQKSYREKIIQTCKDFGKSEYFISEALTLLQLDIELNLQGVLFSASKLRQNPKT